MSEKRALWFQGGTLVLDGVGHNERVPDSFEWVKGKWRCPGYTYRSVLPWMKSREIQNRVARWRPLDCQLSDSRALHPYQSDALNAWVQAGHRGSVVLPTGSGKTLVGLHAIARVGYSAVVVAPTLPLMHQWWARLTTSFATDVGVYYGSEKRVLPLTVTTYSSAGDLLSEHPFCTVLFDEVHHLPSPTWGESAYMTPAPARLGLTATYPEPAEQTDGRWDLEELIGPIVFSLHIDDLAGDQLARYRTQRIRVRLTEGERERYVRDYAVYSGYIQERCLRQTHGADWLMELMKLSTREKAARRAWLARQRLTRLVAGCEEKFRVVEALLREHFTDRVLIFAGNNEVAHQVSLRFLVPIICFETETAERKQILEAFEAGIYRCVVSTETLDEGIDIPSARVAIIIGGSSNARQQVQRLGRILRKAANKEAVLYEVLARGTIEEGEVERRKLTPARHDEKGAGDANR